jgi:hypothetical protein
LKGFCDRTLKSLLRVIGHLVFGTLLYNASDFFVLAIGFEAPILDLICLKKSSLEQKKKKKSEILFNF